MFLLRSHQLPLCSASCSIVPEGQRLICKGLASGFNSPFGSHFMLSYDSVFPLSFLCSGKPSFILRPTQKTPISLDWSQSLVFLEPFGPISVKILSRDVRVMLWKCWSLSFDYRCTDIQIILYSSVIHCILFAPEEEKGKHLTECLNWVCWHTLGRQKQELT